MYIYIYIYIYMVYSLVLIMCVLYWPVLTWKTFMLATCAASRVSDWRPDPPTPSSSALPEVRVRKVGLILTLTYICIQI